MPCPAASAWVSLAFGETFPDAREGLLRHAEACDGCRGDLAAALAALEPGPLPDALRARALQALPRRAVPRWHLAAAALLLAAGGFRFWRPFQAVVAPRRSAPRPLPSAPVSPFGARDRALGIGRSGSLSVRGASRVTVTGNRARLDEGILTVTARGETLEVGWEGGVLTLDEGEAMLEVREEARASAALLRDAFADGAPRTARIWLLSGKARLVAGALPEPLFLEGGKAVRVSGGRVAVLRLPPPGGAGWTRSTDLPIVIRDAARDLAPPGLPEDYRWEAVLTRRTPEAAVALQFVAGGEGWRLPLGARLAGAPGDWVRVGVEVREGWARVEVGGQEIAFRPLAALKGQAEPAGVSAPGLRVWGGDVEVRARQYGATGSRS